jgi:hypothetical protein
MYIIIFFSIDTPNFLSKYSLTEIFSVFRYWTLLPRSKLIVVVQFGYEEISLEIIILIQR